MHVSLLQRLMCLLLSLVMLEAVSHHGLCAAGIIECTPCQTADHEDEDQCPSCSVSQCMITDGILKAKQVSPSATLLFPNFELTKMLLNGPVGKEPPVIRVDDPSTPRHDYLRDLRQSIPIRAPSLTA